MEQKSVRETINVFKRIRTKRTKGRLGEQKFENDPDPLLHTKNYRTGKTLDFTWLICCEKGEDCAIGRESDDRRFLRFRR